MILEANTVEIKNLPLLKFSAPIDGRERWQTRPICAIMCPHSNNHGSMFVRYRIEVIDRFEVTGKKLLLCFFDFLFFSFYDLLYLHFLRHFSIQPVHTRDV